MPLPRPTDSSSAPPDPVPYPRRPQGTSAPPREARGGARLTDVGVSSRSTRNPRRLRSIDGQGERTSVEGLYNRILTGFLPAISGAAVDSTSGRGEAPEVAGQPSGREISGLPIRGASFQNHAILRPDPSVPAMLRALRRVFQTSRSPFLLPASTGPVSAPGAAAPPRAPSPALRSLPALLPGLVLLLALGACAPRGGGGPALSEGPVPLPSPLLDPTSPEMTAEAPALFKVLFETTAGDIVVEVERGLAPLGADRFHNLARAGYFDGVRFFRVVPGFVVQFGLSGDPEVSAAWRNARLEDDPVVGANVRGTLSYAMAGPGTRTVQVFINLGDNRRLDDQGFAPFGRVSGGMDVVDRLFGGYGDGAPRGQGPDQGRIQQEGERYLAASFPQLDQIIRARILEVPQPDVPDVPEVPAAMNPGGETPADAAPPHAGGGR